MTYDQLITLVNIVSEGSFKAAAEVMHKTQPSLTMAIKKLEEEFGIAVKDEEMIPENLDSINNLSAFIQRKKT